MAPIHILMKSKWEKVAESRNPATGAHKSLFLKIGADSSQNQFKIKWQWSHKTPHKKTLYDMSSALEFYEGIRIAIPTQAMLENNRLRRKFLAEKLEEIQQKKDIKLHYKKQPNEYEEKEKTAA